MKTQANPEINTEKQGYEIMHIIIAFLIIIFCLLLSTPLFSVDEDTFVPRHLEQFIKEK